MTRPSVDQENLPQTVPLPENIIEAAITRSIRLRLCNDPAP
ncbi:MAG: hypothetical protein P0107_03090 [Nitrosomonas sp.]|nr:hypothetical protein [Nitrosomonas sp.]